MKKHIAAFAVTAFLLAGLCGCTSQSGQTDPQTEDLPALVIGSDDYEPYNYLDEDGNYAGIDVDLAKEACARIGYTPVFKSVVWDKKDEYLASGEVDCLWACFTMTGREDLYQWAGPYLYSLQTVAVRSDSGITSLADLKGKRFAVQATTKPERALLDREDPRIPQVGSLYSVSTMDELYASLRGGYVDAIAGHENAMNVLVNSDTQRYRMLDESLYVSELGVAFAKDADPALVQALAQALKEMKEDGTVKEIVEKHGLDAGKALGEEESGNA